MTTCVTHITNIGARDTVDNRDTAKARVAVKARDDRVARRWRRRLYAFVVAIVLGTTIAYGEAWFLQDAPSSGLDSVAAGSVARALAGDFAPN